MRREEIVHRAMVNFVRKQLRKNTLLDADGWIKIMNNYVSKVEPKVSAKELGINEIEASIIYCGFALAISKESIQLLKNN